MQTNLTIATVLEPLEIIRKHRLPELMAAPLDKLCLFLGIRQGGADFKQAITCNTEHQNIMEVWEKQLRKHHAPYAVTVKDNSYQLWKIDETLNEKEVKALRKRNEPGVHWFAESPLMPNPEHRKRPSCGVPQAGPCQSEGCDGDAEVHGLCRTCNKRKTVWESKGRVFDYVRKERKVRTDKTTTGANHDR